MQLGKLAFAAVASSWTFLQLSEEAEKRFPPKKPEDLAPLKGYKIFGYMGCPISSVPKIQERSRNLFFDTSIGVPQKYALSRSYFEDLPVVLQIEIPQDCEITQKELWRDPLLKESCATLVPRTISLWPAIPPALQKKVDLQVRIHHVVTPEVLQENGGLKRAFKHITSKLT